MFGITKMTVAFASVAVLIVLLGIVAYFIYSSGQTHERLKTATEEVEQGDDYLAKVTQSINAERDVLNADSRSLRTDDGYKRPVPTARPGAGTAENSGDSPRPAT